MPAGLFCQLALTAPAKALGDPVHRRLSAKKRWLPDRLDGLEAEHSALQRALTRVTSDALTDPLTGLANRRAFEDALRAAAARAFEALAAQLLIADIEVLNDAHGHRFGDAVLRITGEVLQAAVRWDTVMARLGGDEFALLLPGPTADCPVKTETAAIAHTVRGHSERRERVTLSIGLAGWRPGEGPADWYKRTGAALYAAKRSGSNQEVVAEATSDCRPAASSARRGRESS